MTKFNKHDQFVIEQALELWVKQFEKEIKEVEAQGKHSLYSINYPSTVAEFINTKVESLTKKK